MRSPHSLKEKPHQSHKPAALLPCFWSACLDSVIQGKISLLSAAVHFGSAALRGRTLPCAPPCAGGRCAAGRWLQPKPLTAAWLRKRCCCCRCWVLCVIPPLFCMSVKCGPSFLWPCDAVMAAKCHMAASQRAAGFWPERIHEGGKDRIREETKWSILSPQWYPDMNSKRLRAQRGAFRF